MRRTALALVLAGCVPAEPPAVDDTEAPPAPTCAPGTGLHRLGVRQLHAALSELLGVDVDVSGMPLDDVRSGFEAQTEGQAESATFAAQWVSTVEAATARALGLDRPTWTGEVEDLGVEVGDPMDSVDGKTWWVLGHGDPAFPIAPTWSGPGRYRIDVTAVWWQGWEDTSRGTLPARLRVLADGASLGEVTVDNVYQSPRVFPFEVDVGETPPAITIETVWQGEPTLFGRVATAFDVVEVVGPLAPVPAPMVPLLACRTDAAPTACLHEALRPWLRRAWHRPVTDAELDDLVALATASLAAGDGWEHAVDATLRSALLAPEVLFRVEPPTDEAATSWPLDPFALAARLSLVARGTFPDDALLACAEAGTLVPGRADGCAVEAQLDRLLDDPGAVALTDDFADQWLQLGMLGGLIRDPAVYPGFDPAVGASMRTSVLLGVTELVHDDLPVTALLDADSAWVDAALAGVYGVEAPPSGFARVPLPGDRRGLLASAAVLAETSFADRPSLVRRGKFVLANLVCDPPEPPPPNVPQLPAGVVSGDEVELLAAHTASPVCRDCHSRIDPYGIALAGYDAVGRARTTYPDGTPVDAATALPDGTPVAGAGDLAAVVAADPRTVPCVASKLFTWAMERPPVDGDAATLGAMVEAGTLRGMLRAVVTSPAFLRRDTVETCR